MVELLEFDRGYVAIFALHTYVVGDAFRVAFFVAANAATFTKESSFANISLADCTWVIYRSRVKLNIPRE